MTSSQGPWRDRYGYGHPETRADWDSDRGEAPNGEHYLDGSMPLPPQHSNIKNDRKHQRVSEEASRYEGRSGFGGGELETNYKSRREYEYEKRTQQMRRRGSPVYEEYSGRHSDPHDRSAASSSQPVDSNNRGYAHGDMSSRSYSTYRRQPENERRSASPASSPSSSSKVYVRPPQFAPRSPPPRPTAIDLPPPPPPRRTEPTAEYLTTSLHPSQRIDDPTSSRKLIVLDLNGSLIVRSAHQKRAPYANPTQQRPLRAVHARPYLSSFTSYLLHPETKKWLDAMVWSSAQPHSVDDMVQRSFKERRKELKAIWARDTLGLSGNDYYQKTQTVKDLEKPWAELSAIPPPPPLPPSAITLSSVMSFDDVEIQPPISPSRLGVEEHHPRHSAKTTLLVDDSPLKAILQPWNHLCIREYVQEMRRLDLAVADWEWAAQQAREANGGKALQEETNKPEDTNTATETATTFEPEVTRVIREVVMVDGQMVNTEEVVKRVTREVVMIQGKLVDDPSASASASAGTGVSAGAVGAGASVSASANAHDPEGAPPTKQPPSNVRRKLKRMKKREKEREEREGKEREAFLSLAAQRVGSASASASAAASGPNSASASGGEQLQEESEVRLSGDQPILIQYDPTLLAVVGILDHLKHEDNVAGWMRSGGLLHIHIPSTPTSDSYILHEAEEATPDSESDPKKTIHTPPTRDESPSEVQGPAKRRKVEEDDHDHDAESDLEIQPPPSARMSSLPLSLSVPPSSSAPGSPGPATLPLPASSPPTALTTREMEQEGEEEEQASTGIPTSPAGPAPVNARVHVTGSPSSLKSKLKETKEKETTSQGQPLWFDHPTVLAYWASRGREALRELGIEVESGVNRAPGGLQQK